MSRAFKASEAAEYLGAHVETIRRMARRGEIPSFKVGKDWRFRETELNRWVETHHLRQRSAHILAVDDEENFLNSLRRMLHDAPYRISTVTDGMQALELISRVPPDVVLLDLKMPDMSGPATLREIRKIDEKLPVIIITGYPNSELMNEALQYSPFLMLPKPVEIKQLIDAVDLALNGSKSKGAHAGRS